VNLIVTMVLGGLWHGAGWTFLCWGTLHGLYLVVNHYWRGLVGRRSGAAYRVFAWTMTMLAVVVAWVLFRADGFGTAASVLQSMFVPGSTGTADVAPLVARGLGWAAVAIGIVAVVSLPSVLEITRYPWSTPGLPIEHDGLVPVTRTVPSLVAAVLLGLVAAVAFAKLPDPGVFLYFNF